MMYYTQVYQQPNSLLNKYHNASIRRYQNLLAVNYEEQSYSRRNGKFQETQTEIKTTQNWSQQQISSTRFHPHLIRSNSNHRKQWIPVLILTTIGALCFRPILHKSVPPPNNFNVDISIMWLSGSVVVKALCYKPEGRGLNTR
jgi:hypothetical protein